MECTQSVRTRLTRSNAAHEPRLLKRKISLNAKYRYGKYHVWIPPGSIAVLPGNPSYRLTVVHAAAMQYQNRRLSSFVSPQPKSFHARLSLPHALTNCTFESGTKPGSWSPVTNSPTACKSSQENSSCGLKGADRREGVMASGSGIAELPGAGLELRTGRLPESLRCHRSSRSCE